MTSLDRLLESCRATTVSEREQDAALEKPVAERLVADPVHPKRFAHAELRSDRACRRELDWTGIRIELAGRLRDNRFVAIRPTFLDPERRIREADIDTFISASAKPAFAERLIVENTDMPWRTSAQVMQHGKTIPTTDAASLARSVSASDTGPMHIEFATCQSTSVIETIQAGHGLPEFDLIICVGVHRTTGVTFAGEEQSNLVSVHDNEPIRVRKRLHRTATPRGCGNNANSRTRDAQAALASMDTPGLYGEILFHQGLAWAVGTGIRHDPAGRAGPCGKRGNSLQYTATHQVAPRDRADREGER